MLSFRRRVDRSDSTRMPTKSHPFSKPRRISGKNRQAYHAESVLPFVRAAGIPEATSVHLLHYLTRSNSC